MNSKPDSEKVNIMDTKNLTNGLDQGDGLTMVTSKSMEALKTHNINDLDEDLKKLPLSVKRRLKALKKLQVESIGVEAKFYERVHQLEVEFCPLFAQLNEKRRDFVVGDKEPTDQEADYPLVQNFKPEQLKELDDMSAPELEVKSKGIPGFWLRSLKNVDHICEMIEECDEPILKHLIDITCDVKADPDSYTLTFHFEPNEYFKQTELEKHYFMQMGPSEDEVFDYDGPMVVKATGTEIDWYDGKNVTLKVIKKKQRKGTNASRFITKTIRADSFFNFFDPPITKSKEEMNEDDYMSDDCSQELLQADFEIGQLFRDQIVPRAVVFYTGEMAEDPNIYEDYDDGDDDDELDPEEESDKD